MEKRETNEELMQYFNNYISSTYNKRTVNVYKLRIKDYIKHLGDKSILEADSMDENNFINTLQSQKQSAKSMLHTLNNWLTEFNYK